MAWRAAAVVFVVSLLLLPLRHAGAQETDDENEFSYRRGEENGPERWGFLKREWATCARGRMQSPISIPVAVVRGGHRRGRLSRSYQPAHASMVNRGHDIMVRFDDDAGFLLIDNTAYRLKQMHWPSPSEHAVNGRRYDLELHMLHQSDEGNKFAVVAQLFEIGRRHDDTLRTLEPYIERIANRRKHHEEEIDEPVNPGRLSRGVDAYYTYTGSLTTPPCTEGVTWAVAEKVRHVTRHQVEMLRDAVHDGARNNARPLQEGHGRVFTLYYPWSRGTRTSDRQHR